MTRCKVGLFFFFGMLVLTEAESAILLMLFNMTTMGHSRFSELANLVIKQSNLMKSSHQ